MKTKFSVLGLAVLLALGTNAVAADYPAKPIRMIVPWSAGGGSDVLIRAFQPSLEKELGQRILIENIPAGATKVGTLELMKAKADGYTLLFSNEAWITRYYAKTYTEKVWEQMTPIANVTSEPIACIEVKADSPFKTFEDLVKAAKANPGKLTCGNPGVGSPLDIVFDEMTKSADLDIQYVPFAGGGQSKVAMLGGHIDFRVCQPTEAIAMVRAGQSRVLVNWTDPRSPAFPTVPTAKELGLKYDEQYKIIRGIWAPANMPAAIVEKLNKAVEKATKDPAFKKIAEDQFSYTIDYRNSKQVKDFVANFDKMFGPMLAKLNS
ncbi:MAG: tripartite tricarboxylate transporter substrate binding protein [Treponemataceae bacterium]